MMAVDLPWPSPDLSPNARLHWAAKAKAVKEARRDAVIAARAAGIKRACARRATVTLTFSPPDNRRRDTDNMLSSCKGYCEKWAAGGTPVASFDIDESEVFS